MKCYIGLGSNVGDRLSLLEQAAKAIYAKRASPLYETPALVPAGAPEDWRKPYLNAVVEINWDSTPQDLLLILKKTEKDLGRTPSARWAPRKIDLDLLLFGKEVVETPHFRVPHAALAERSFVLDPLAHLAPSMQIPMLGRKVLAQARLLSHRQPLWQGILNLTPDSFSDGGSNAKFAEKLLEWEKENVQLIDLGAESTRPGATPVDPEEEWKRLQPALEWLQTRYQRKIFRPWISVDTRHLSTAKRARELGADIINDVSGLANIELAEVAPQYVLMHSLGVPADRALVLSTDDPVQEVKRWAEEKLEFLSKRNISLDRVIFDPGIGFGKTAAQSFALLRGIKAFHDLPVRLLVGHSRKAFLNHWGERPAPERDAETLGVSFQLAQKGVDIVRVHSPELHARAFRAFQETGL